MNVPRPTIRLAVALVVGCGFASRQASAQMNSAPIELQTFRPAMDSKGYLTLNASQILAPGDFSFGLVLTYARRPLEFTEQMGAGGMPSSYTVHNLVTPSFQGAVGLASIGQVGLELGLVLPLGVMSSLGEPYDPGPDANNANDDKHFVVDGQGLGDLVVHPKLRLLNSSRQRVGVAVIPSLVLPTGRQDRFLGEGQIIFQPTLVLDLELGRPGAFRIGLNAGARVRSKGASEFVDSPANFPRPVGGIDQNTNHGIRVGNELLGGLGFAWGIMPLRVELVAEVFSHIGLASKQIGPAGETDLGPGAEAIAGIKLYLARNSFFQIGGGLGVMRSYGAPDFRGFLGFIFEPSIGDRDGDGIKDDVDKCPDDPEDFDDFEDQDGCPEPDNDKDRILDIDDDCPNVPETYNGIKDDDGCPDDKGNDRDGDGIPDDVDKCPDDPEDFDDFEDQDGCPDPDNDQDGILDKDDLCPNDPEDKDGFEDQDGCPDPDNDKDRILDVSDRCPNEPETYNGNEDEDGCPDKGRVIVRKSKIEILDKIYFETDRADIKPVSFPLLDAIAATIKGHPELMLIEIQGHADERGDDGYNLDLTDRRAHSVLRAIEERGVEPGRMRAKGFGERQPVCRAHNEDCWSQNRRTEFIIIRRSEEPSLWKGGEGQ